MCCAMTFGTSMSCGTCVAGSCPNDICACSIGSTVTCFHQHGLQLSTVAIWISLTFAPLLPAALTQRLQLSVADARSDLERHSSLRPADLRSELSTSGQRAGQHPTSPDRPPSSPASRLPQTPQTPSGFSSALSSPGAGSQRHWQPSSAHDQSAMSSVRPSVPKRPSFSSGGGPSRQHRQAAWD